MTGVTQQKPRWKRAMRVPNSILGEAVGKMYVEKYFPESSKKKMLTLVKNLQDALGEHIDNLDWMSDSTKVKAREKLSAFTVKIGYPDKWKDYSTLNVDPALSYYENLRAASCWSIADNMAKLGKPTDRSEWGMTPQTINAYYDPTSNEICFPAAILQPPFFNPDADDAVNYGAIGVVIGHEMSHGFDDQGRLFDKNGNKVNWWTAEDAAKFDEKANVLVSQFDEVEILPGLKADGRLTVGENIGDHGGLSIAYSAMEKRFRKTARASSTASLLSSVSTFHTVSCGRPTSETLRKRGLRNSMCILSQRTGSMSHFATSRHSSMHSESRKATLCTGLRANVYISGSERFRIHITET